MTDVPSPSSILVDVELPDPAPFSSDLVDVLASLRVIVLGWYAVPEQTNPEQARDQFGKQAAAALDAVAEQFRAAGAEVTTRLVFTGNKFDTLTRISTEEDCDAVLLPGPMRPLQKVLVPLRGMPNAARIAPFVADLIRDSSAGQASSAGQHGTTDVTLLHILDDEEAEAAAREDVLQPAADLMTNHGIDAGLLRLETAASDDPADTIVETSKDHDLVVLGETEPTVRDILFGTIPERVVKTAQVPVVMVRHEEEDVDMAERATQTGRA